jgi:hypothetical protein
MRTDSSHSRMRLIFALATLMSLFASASSQSWKEEFNLAGRQLTTTGKSKFLILTPGYQIVLADQETTLTFTVLNQTRKVGEVTTRVVEEKEEVNGEVTEIAQDFYAMDQETGDVFHFGENVDAYEKGKVVGHTGTWMAYKNGAKPGLLVPGKPEVGMRYYQEIAPGVATDRAEVTSVSGTLKTPAGQFKDCVIAKVSSKTHPTEISVRTYAPNVGLAQFESLKLIRYGMRN